MLNCYKYVGPLLRMIVLLIDKLEVSLYKLSYATIICNFSIKKMQVHKFTNCIHKYIHILATYPERIVSLFFKFAVLAYPYAVSVSMFYRLSFGLMTS
jgi:hypothetical protein